MTVRTGPAVRLVYVAHTPDTALRWPLAPPSRAWTFSECCRTTGHLTPQTSAATSPLYHHASRHHPPTLAAEGVHECVQGDAYTCAVWGNRTTSPNMWEQCSSTCNSTLDREVTSRIEEYGTGDYRDYMDYTAGDKSWYVVCAWQGITELPKMCNDTFAPTLPMAASNNFGVTVNDTSEQILFFNDSAVSWDSCNVHAFCYTCTEDDGSLNKYCEAVLQKYTWDGFQTPTDIRDLVYDDMVRGCCRSLSTLSVHPFTRTCCHVAAE